MDKKIEFNSSKVYVKFSDTHGRGVFAKQPIEIGETVEIFPITPASFRTHYQGDINFLQYGFVNKSCHCEECKRHGNVVYISSGYGNMYNHQTSPKNNANFNIDYSNLCGKVEAIKVIKKDEEIRFLYLGAYTGHGYSFRLRLWLWFRCAREISDH